MPPRPVRECRHAGCRELTRCGFCDAHAQDRHRDDPRRGSSAQRGYDARHRRWRAMILARDPICVDPYGRHARDGIVVPSTVADHIVPLRPDGAGDWSLENGRGLCAACHGERNIRGLHRQRGREGR